MKCWNRNAYETWLLWPVLESNKRIILSISVHVVQQQHSLFSRLLLNHVHMIVAVFSKYFRIKWELLYLIYLTHWHSNQPCIGTFKWHWQWSETCAKIATEADVLICEWETISINEFNIKFENLVATHHYVILLVLIWRKTEVLRKNIGQ